MRPEKTSIINEIRAQLSGASFVFLANYEGLKVSQACELRQRLARLNSEYHVVRNSFFRIAAAELKWDQIAGGLTGPTAMVAGRGDAVETAKVLHAFGKENKTPVVKMGLFDGRHISTADFEALVQLPPRQVLLGMLVGTLAAPMTRLVGTMQQKVASIVYALKAIQEKKSKTQ